MYRKILILTLSLTLLVLAAVGGTLTWLQAKTDPVTNTFVAGDIKLRLTDTTGSYKMVPGVAINEEIKVTVEAGSEACYVYIKVEKSQNFDVFFNYELDVGEDNWKALTGYDGIYYREVSAVAAGTAVEQLPTFAVLSGNKLTTKPEITKEQLNALTAETYPKLTVTAYAVQSEAIGTPVEAWQKTFGNETTPSTSAPEA